MIKKKCKFNFLFTTPVLLTHGKFVLVTNLTVGGYYGYLSPQTKVRLKILPSNAVFRNYLKRIF